MNAVKVTRRRWPKGAWMKPKCQIIHAMLANSPHSYAAVAGYLGCSKQMVGHLAKDPRKTCSPALASKLAVFLGVPVEAIFDVHVPSAASQSGAMRRAA
jgi:DNA-binding XRE family transcriptional regulator